MKAIVEISFTEKENHYIGRKNRRFSHSEMMDNSSVKGSVRESKKSYKRKAKHRPDWKKF